MATTLLVRTDGWAPLGAVLAGTPMAGSIVEPRLGGTRALALYLAGQTAGYARAPTGAGRSIAMLGLFAGARGLQLRVPGPAPPAARLVGGAALVDAAGGLGRGPGKAVAITMPKIDVSWWGRVRGFWVLLRALGSRPRHRGPASRARGTASDPAGAGWDAATDARTQQAERLAAARTRLHDEGDRLQAERAYSEIDLGAQGRHAGHKRAHRAALRRFRAGRTSQERRAERSDATTSRTPSR